MDSHWLYLPLISIPRSGAKIRTGRGHFHSWKRILLEVAAGPGFYKFSPLKARKFFSFIQDSSIDLVPQGSQSLEGSLPEALILNFSPLRYGQSLPSTARAGISLFNFKLILRPA